MLPLVVSAIALALEHGDGFMPVGDLALIELRVRDVGSDTPLVGLWSRQRWNHPGPLGFFVLTPTYRLLGSTSIGLHLGALVVNGAALTGIALVSRRRGGTPLMLCTLVVCSLMVLNLGADFVRSPWNPYLPVLSYGLLILLAWSMACGETWALPVAVAVASFAAQTHVGFVALSLPLLVWGAAGLVRSSVQQARSGPQAAATAGADPPTAASSGRAPLRALLSPALLSLGLAAVLWLPPLIDVLINRRTNADQIIRYFRDSDQPSLGLIDAWRIMAGQFSFDAEWLTGRQPTVIGETAFVHVSPLPWLLVPLAAVAVIVWRWSRPGDRALVGTLLVAFGTGMVAVSRIIGKVADYRLQPTWWPAALAGVMALWVAWRAGSGRWPNAERRWLVPLAGAALVILTGVTSVSAARSDLRHTADSQIMARLMPGVLDVVRPGQGEVLVVEGSGRWSFYVEPLVLQLERKGIDTVVLPGELSELRFGQDRIQGEEDEPQATLVVVALSDNLEAWATNPNVVPIATWSAEEDPIDASRGPVIDRVTVFLKQRSDG